MLSVTRLTDKDLLEIDLVNSLYDSAFPEHEKRRYQGRNSIQRLDDYYLYYFSDNGAFIGFIGSWKIDDFFYIEHFAVLPTSRGQGYGQKVLKMFSWQVKNIILEIDPVIDEISQKRLRFYQHCGFKENNYSHVHPSYHPQYEPHKLEILSFPISISRQTYQTFNQKLNQVVMQPSLL
ncbi:GNAT family N-acetyltransferase [Orbus wheelerorum]|uniref:GNAT family N-acetyltransferase n=1 Tax=Orbus wheelerorum TaxID=3074111 RepID=UPI00370DBCA5